MPRIQFSLDSDPWHGGHDNNVNQAKMITDKIISSRFQQFGITWFEAEVSVSYEEMMQKLEDLYTADKIRGAKMHTRY